MLPEIIYRKASEEFEVAVGVAKIMGYKKKKEHITEVTPETYKQLSTDLDINWIIAESIYDGSYKQLQREVYRLKRTNKRLKSELSIYNRAYKTINGEIDTNNTKSRKVQANR